jgi:hypothetical protein
MLKTRHSVAALTPMLVLAGGFNHKAEAVDLSQDLQMRQLHATLQSSVCRNDWDTALAAIGPLMVTPGLPTQYQEQLVRFRRQLDHWRASDAEFVNIPNCGGAIATSPFGGPSGVQTFERPTANVRTQDLYAGLRGAVCQNDWDLALGYIGPLMASGVSPSYREYLVSLRRQVEHWRAASTRLASTPGCGGSIAQAPAVIDAPQMALEALSHPDAIALPEFS